MFIAIGVTLFINAGCAIMWWCGVTQYLSAVVLSACEWQHLVLTGFEQLLIIAKLDIIFTDHNNYVG